METNRRGFLGIFGAGAIAGPRLAAGIAQSVADNSPMPGGGYSLNDETSPIKGDWRVKQIAKLKKIISGKDPAAAREQTMHRLYMADNCERVRLDGLRSISPCHKMSMLVDTERDRKQRISRADAGFSLARLLKGED